MAVCPEPSLYVYFKDFAGPVMTLAAATAAIGVTYRFSKQQALTAAAALKASENKLALDLFDKRWAITSEIRSIVGNSQQHDIPTFDNYIHFLRASKQAEFLFGPEVKEFLETIADAFQKIRGANIKSGDQQIRDKAFDVIDEMYKKTSAFFDKFDDLIAPYMSMQHKVSR